MIVCGVLDGGKCDGGNLLHTVEWKEITLYHDSDECEPGLPFPTSNNSALIRPLEELLHLKCSTLRGELDSSTPY